MYQVIKDNAVMAYVGDPVFIRIHTNGCYVAATEDEAQGIAIQSTPYHILGREELPGAVATVMIVKIDGGVVIANQQDSINELIQTVLEG